MCQEMHTGISVYSVFCFMSPGAGGVARWSFKTKKIRMLLVAMNTKEAK